MKYILCYGDSNTHGYDPADGLRYPEDVRWTGRLSHLMGDNYKIIEEGLNSRTTALEPEGEPWRSGLYCLEPCIRTHMPVDLLILMLGSNDMKTAFAQDEKQIGHNVRELIRTAKRVSADKDPQGKPCKILLVSPLLIGEEAPDGPFGDEFDYRSIELSKKLAPVYRQIAKEEGTFYLDAAKCAAPGSLDGLHMDPAGHKNLAEAMVVKVWEIIAG